MFGLFKIVFLSFVTFLLTSCSSTSKTPIQNINEAHEKATTHSEWTVKTSDRVGDSIHTSHSPNHTYIVDVIESAGDEGYLDKKDNEWVVRNNGGIRIYFGEYGDPLTQYVVYPREKLPGGFNAVSSEWLNEYQVHLTATANTVSGETKVGEPVKIDIQELLKNQTP